MLKKILIGTAFTVLVTILGGVTLAGWLYDYSRKEGPPGPPTIVVSIPKGASVERIGEILAHAGIIHGDRRFTYLARLRGMADKLRAGEFALKTGKLPYQVMLDLATAVPLQYRVTFAEGLNAHQIATILAENNWCDRNDFLKSVRDPQFIASLGFSTLSTLEGYLYPDTYYLTRVPKISTEDIIRIMVERFQAVWAELGGSDERKHEVVTLASIVEKETGAPSERARIASVFFNRLKRGMRLQSDPTVVYGLSDFDGNITRKDLQRHTPYNTYVISGLPPGPIANPGKEALAAVLQPESGAYLYFVSKNDGTHYFSKSLKEHNRAVYKYQKRKAKP